MTDPTRADISQFEQLQTDANRAMGMTQNSVFNDRGQVDNAVHYGEVKDEDDALLKLIMRAAAHIEGEALDYAGFASGVKKQLASGDQIERAIKEPQFDAAIKEAFEEYRERFQGIAKQGKDKLGLETRSTASSYLDAPPQEISPEQFVPDPRNFGERIRRDGMVWDKEDFAKE